MHELSIAAALIDTVEEQRRVHAFSRVRVIRLRIGALSNVVPDALVFGFDALKPGTAAEHARLEFERAEEEVRCRTCGRRRPVDAADAPCPGCGARTCDAATGEELDIIALDVE